MVRFESMVAATAAEIDMTRVLVIEDDDETANEIVAELQSSGFDVDREATGVTGLRRIETDSYDVVTLDRMLPGLDGLEILEEIRRAGIATPVLVLSALGDVDERVRGLRAGGDDYLTKPFALLEMRARVEALARRAPEPRQTVLHIGTLELDLLAQTVRRGGRAIDLTPREMVLLKFMMENTGQVLTRAMLFEHVWRYRFDPGTNLVDVHLGRLRRKVDAPGEPMLIHTIRKIGFILRASE
jgi:two-component system OmpR family response regulator